jgi:hypothetical protein
MPNLSNVEEFEKEWVALSEEVIRRIFSDPDIIKLKTELREKGRLTIPQRSKFITIVDKLKYEVIFKKYGPAESDGFKSFTRHWEQWLAHRGVARNKPKNLFEENINHLLFGSTPDPEQFLREFKLYDDAKLDN